MKAVVEFTGRDFHDYRYISDVRGVNLREIYNRDGSLEGYKFKLNDVEYRDMPDDMDISISYIRRSQYDGGKNIIVNEDWRDFVNSVLMKLNVKELYVTIDILNKELSIKAYSE